MRPLARRRMEGWVGFGGRRLVGSVVSGIAAKAGEPAMDGEDNGRAGEGEQGIERSGDRSGHGAGAGHERQSMAEKTTLGVSMLVVAALVGAALFEHFGREEPAGTWVTVEVASERAERRGDRFYVPFAVANAGAEPAEEVEVVFEVTRGEEVLEESTTTIAFLPATGSAAGELVTEFDPATHGITARVGTLQGP